MRSSHKLVIFTDILKPRVSFQVTDTEAKKAEAVRTVAVLDENFEDIVYDSGKSAQVQTIGAFHLKVTVPFGVSAKIVLPNTAREPQEVEAVSCLRIRAP